MMKGLPKSGAKATRLDRNIRTDKAVCIVVGKSITEPSSYLLLLEDTR